MDTSSNRQKELSLEKLAKLRKLAALRDTHARLKAQTLDVFSLIDYVPQPPQLEFHNATEHEVGFGGRAGGGKTKALVADFILKCIRHPGLTCFGFRRTYPELQDSLIKELAMFGYAKSLGAKWNASERELKFDNGSQIKFRYAETLQDASRYQGSEIQYLGIDEATLMPPDVITYLTSRIRSGRKDLPVIGMRTTANPGGIGHSWYKSRYIDLTEHGKKSVEIKNDSGDIISTVRFIDAPLSPHVDDNYKNRLDSLPEDQRRALRDGNWDVFSGQAFKEWNRGERHIVPAHFEVNPEWPVYIGIDYGYTAPWAVLWGAVDRDGRVWIHDEIYLQKVSEHFQPQMILARNAGRRTPELINADPAMFHKQTGPKSIADVYSDNGVVLKPANNDRLAGWQRVHTYLTEAPACEWHRKIGWDMCPLLHVIDNKASNLVRTLPNLPYSRQKTEDVDTHAEDHAADALRYLLMGIGTESKFYLGGMETAELTYDHLFSNTQIFLSDPWS